MVRRGLGKGRGKGYHNITPKDPRVHSQSARGIKQPQNIGLLTTAKPVNTLVQKLKDFEDFKQGKRQRIQRGVRGGDTFRRRNTIIKDRGDNPDIAIAESQIMNDLVREFPFYPQGIVRQHKGRYYILTDDVEARPVLIPIQKLNTNQKFQLAKAQRFLLQKKLVDFDFRKDNIVLDKEQNAIIIDFDKVKRMDDKTNREIQYNLNILSIFGLRDDRARRFTTMSLKELGIR